MLHTLKVLHYRLILFFVALVNQEECLPNTIVVVVVVVYLTNRSGKNVSANHEEIVGPYHHTIHTVMYLFIHSSRAPEIHTVLHMRTVSKFHLEPSWSLAGVTPRWRHQICCCWNTSLRFCFGVFGDLSLSMGSVRESKKTEQNWGEKLTRTRDLEWGIWNPKSGISQVFFGDVLFFGVLICYSARN